MLIITSISLMHFNFIYSNCDINFIELCCVYNFFNCQGKVYFEVDNNNIYRLCIDRIEKK